MPHSFPPILWVQTPGINCLASWNGVPLGQTRDALSVSIARDGQNYIVLHPLDQTADAVTPPFACVLCVQDGRPAEGLPDGATLLCTPDGALLLSVSMPFYPYNVQRPPHGMAQVRFSVQGIPHLATLFYDNGTKVCVEQDLPAGQILAIVAVPDVTDGRLQAVDAFGTGNLDLVLQAETAAGARFLLLSAAEQYAKVLDLPGEGTIGEGAVTILADLGNHCRHQRKTTLQLHAGNISRQEQIGHFTNTPPALSGMQMCIAFCECVQLAQYQEALEYLSPQLAADLDADAFAEFFGAFSLIRPMDETGDTVRLSLGTPTLPNCFRLREYVFSLVQGRIDTIYDAEDE